MGQDQGVSGIHGPDRGAIAFGLGHADPGFAEGVPGDRSDAIRTRIDRHGDVTRLPAERTGISVAGLAAIGPDVTPELARETIGTLTVPGSLHASPALRAALADRLR